MCWGVCSTAFLRVVRSVAYRDTPLRQRHRVVGGMAAPLSRTLAPKRAAEEPEPVDEPEAKTMRHVTPMELATHARGMLMLCVSCQKHT